MSKLSTLLNGRISQDNDTLIHADGRWHSADELRRDVAMAQGHLQVSGLTAGDRVLLGEVNSYGYIVSYLAMLLLGATVVPVNPAMPTPELQKVMTRSGVVGAWVGDALADAVLSLPSEALRFVAVIATTDEGNYQLTGTSVHNGTRRLHASAVTMESRSGSYMAPDLSEDTGAILLFTSGTTGTPKGVVLTHQQVMATARNVAESHQLTENDVCYSFLPLFHINAQVIGLLTTLTTGGTLVVEQKFSASRFWQTVKERDITWISAVPTVIAILIRSEGEAPTGHRVRFVRSASAPLPSLHARRFEARFSIPIIESYGMTEAASQICVNPVPPGVRKLGSAGLPFGIDLRIMDADGTVVPDGDLGEIAIRGESVISAYASGDMTGSSFRDGWFYTGDIGYVDQDGYVFITGRSKEMINRAGQKISPREVEEVIDQHPAVKAVAVIGLPDDMYGERIVAYVITDPPKRKGDLEFKEELRQLCLRTISAYKCPAEFHLVEEIPLGPTGKIQRSRLREQVLAVGQSN